MRPRNQHRRNSDFCSGCPQAALDVSYTHPCPGPQEQSHTPFLDQLSVSLSGEFSFRGRGILLLPTASAFASTILFSSTHSLTWDVSDSHGSIFYFFLIFLLMSYSSQIQLLVLYFCTFVHAVPSA